jgi:hypothetical protein
MGRWILGLAFGMLLVTAGSANAASSSRLTGGSTFWFYNCSGDQAMYIGVLGADHKVKNVATLEAGDTTHIWLDKGDLVSWRCGAPVAKGNYFIYATVQ